MKALIVGAAGFVGGHLIEELSVRCGWEVAATKLRGERVSRACCGAFDVDILDEDAVRGVMERVKPDIVYHLVAQSSVALSWEKPALTVEVNIKGSVNVLEAARKSGVGVRVVLIGSGEEYGNVREEDCPIKETLEAKPQSVYAVTKSAQNQLGRLYAASYGMDIVMTRSFNHIGVGQPARFVAADLCEQAAEIAAGKREGAINVGNMDVRRDFTDVRDVVRSYRLLGEKGKSGETYNVGSGRAVAIREIADAVIKASGKEMGVKVDEKRLRPVDAPVICADIGKIQRETGWKAEIPLERTLQEIYEWFLRKAMSEG
ncbi:MAG: GDP-mannose 4,6-dehydratase [Treponema sp.]|jgi:GDP-4-dehydro-6-deoxy-D-mannose reductase|nr:GDP-mannose 4,6-dehydratase [Treponema sp.]